MAETRRHLTDELIKMFSAPTFMPAEGAGPACRLLVCRLRRGDRDLPGPQGPPPRRCRHHRRRLELPPCRWPKPASTWWCSRPTRSGWGASGRNGGQIHPGQRQDPDWLCRMVGESVTRDLLTLADEARSYLDRLITENAIDCDFRPGLIHTVHKPRWVDAESAMSTFPPGSGPSNAPSSTRPRRRRASAPTSTMPAPSTRRAASCIR